MRNKLSLITIVIFSSIFILVGCGSQDIDESQNNSTQVSTSQTETTIDNTEKISDDINIVIDGNVQLSETNSVPDMTNVNSSQTRIIKRIISAIQENQTYYTESISMSYDGKYNLDVEGVTPSSFSNNFSLEYIKGINGTDSLIGNGLYKTTGGITSNFEYYIERYADNKTVYYKENKNDEKQWTTSGLGDNSFTKLYINRDSLESALNSSSFTEESTFYLFTINQPLKEMLNTFYIGNLSNIFDEETLNKNISYQLKINKDNNLPEQMVMRKTFNNIESNIKNDYIFNLSSYEVPSESVKNMTLSNISIEYKFNYDDKKKVYIDDEIIYEAKNGPLVDNYEYKTGLTKYDYIDVLNEKNTVLAIFDSSSDTTITASGLNSGLSTEFYVTNSSNENKFLGKLELMRLEKFINKYSISNISELEKIDCEYEDVYEFKNLDNNYNYFIKINDEYGFVYSNNNSSVNLESFLTFFKLISY